MAVGYRGEAPRWQCPSAPIHGLVAHVPPSLPLPSQGTTKNVGRPLGGGLL
ncbi:MAG: hypothetical protein WD711_02975 [Dongiaceae bacterium]